METISYLPLTPAAVAPSIWCTEISIGINHGFCSVVLTLFFSTLNKIHEKDATLTTAFQYGNGIVIAVPVLLIAFVASALIL